MNKFTTLAAAAMLAGFSLDAAAALPVAGSLPILKSLSLTGSGQPAAGSLGIGGIGAMPTGKVIAIIGPIAPEVLPVATEL